MVKLLDINLINYIGEFFDGFIVAESLEGRNDYSVLRRFEREIKLTMRNNTLVFISLITNNYFSMFLGRDIVKQLNCSNTFYIDGEDIIGKLSEILGKYSDKISGRNKS